MKKLCMLFVAVLFLTGMAAQAFAATVSSVHNNFTMLDGTVGDPPTGGTNDVVFTWDGSKKTSVAVSGQVSNASFSSITPFFGVNWTAHDLAIYGPGTYTVYADCPAGSPGCGAGGPITFTVASGQLAAHMLFDWGGNNDIDVVDVWAPNAVFGPSPLFTGPDGGTADPVTVWSFMSTDWNSDGINGYPMVDGPFLGFSANFNVKIAGTDNNNFTMIAPDGSLTGGCNGIAFTWDGTRKTSVECPQVANATLASSCPFYGVNWTAHDVAVYGPGTYTVYDGCPAGCPSCGIGNPITFTVGSGQLGVHMLFDWGGNNDMDVVDVWTPNAVFGPSPLFTGPDGGTIDPATVWDWMSSDWNNDGINGYPMTDGPFVGFNANFNVMSPSCVGCANCDDNNACTIDACDCSSCVHTPIANCCNTAADCNDNNVCTTDSCVNNVCVHTLIDGGYCCPCDPFPTCNPTSGCPKIPCVLPASCNDNNACTLDGCTNNACTHTAIICNDNNACTTDSCNPATGCVFTPKNCDDNNVCTIDTCDTVKGCIHTPGNCCVTPSSNNFTMVDPSGKTIGGTNNVLFSWDGTTKTSVLASGQISNAILSSTCPFQGITWSAHDVAIYGPGSYTVYAGCAAGSPGCGTGTAINFTVGANQRGVHMLFDWGASKNIDVVNVWSPAATFAPSVLWTGACGTAPATTKVWDLMSSDWNNDGKNGYPMVDGPFLNFNANFNIMAGGCGGCVPADCNDNNACTLDSCVAGTCVNTPISCDDGNACTADSCDPATGCVIAAIPCDDGNKCTLDFCDTATGCYTAPVNCNDNSACTIDSCDPATGYCSNTPIICNDNNACTTDTCNPATGCVYTPIIGCGGGDCGECFGNSECPTGMICDMSVCLVSCSCPQCTVCAGRCVPGLPDCNDNDACTMDSYDPIASGCIHTVIMCNDNDACTADWCNPATGCGYTEIDLCRETTNNNFTMIDPGNNTFGGANDVHFSGWNGSWRFRVATSGQTPMATISSPCPFFGTTWSAHDVAIYGPGIYTVYAGCAPGSPGCGTGAPITFAVGADEFGIHMLFDWNGNLNIDVVNVMKQNAKFAPSALWGGGCGSNSACTSWKLMSYDFDGDGINGTPMVDGPFVGMNANFNLGVGAVDLCCNCDDNNACTTDTCNTASGCVHTPIVCNDNNTCTTDTCNTATGCVYTPNANCGACGVCLGNADCPSGMVCTAGIECLPWCDCPQCTVCAGQCVPGCDDNNACTIDALDPATGCKHTVINCDDNNACTIDSCNPATGCVHTPISCNDNNACTTDTCATTGCVHTYIQGCDPQCAGKPNGTHCEVERYWHDPSVCYNDYCSNGVCVMGVEFSCNDNSACTTDFCNTATGCVYTPINCNDNNACTVDSCNPATGCVHTPIGTDDHNACTADSCDPATGAVLHTPIVCNDNNACTADSCDPAIGCVYPPLNCNDNNACTSDSCDPATGCVITPIVCNDNNLCTTDSCNPASGCVFTPLPIVSDNNSCTDDSCDPATGLPVYTNNAAPCDDGLFCTTNDACSNGVCAGGGNPCTGNTVCNEATDQCDCLCAKSVVIRGGGQSPNNVDLQIQTLFTATGGDCGGCLIASSTSSVTFNVGSVISVDINQGKGPAPTSGTWNGASVPLDTPLSIECSTAGTAGKLVLTNKDAVGGNDTDRITVNCQ